MDTVGWRSRRPHRPLWFLQGAALAGLLLLGACDSKPSDDTSLAGADGSVTAPDATAKPTPPEPPPVQRGELVKAVKALFADWAAAEAKLVNANEPGAREALEKIRWYRRMSTKLYEERAFEPIFVAKGELTRGADQLLEALYGVGAHGLDPAPYQLEALKDAVKTFSDRRLAYQEALTTSAEGKSVWDFLMAQRQRLPLDDVALHDAAAANELSDADLPRVAAARKHLEGLLAARGALNQSLRDLDVGLVARYFRYVFDMRFSKRAHPFFAARTDGEGVENTAEDVYAYVKDTDFSAMAPALAGLVPQVEVYSPLMKGLERYRKYAAEHEPIELPRTIERAKPHRPDKPGKPSDVVKLLQQRLQQEDYWDGEIDGIFSPELETAVSFYQDTHQLKQVGTVNRQTRLSLNKTFQERADQIALALRRHRESDLHQGEFRFGETKLRGRVNIPAFQATFYLDGKVARRHRIIVGNNKVETNFSTGKKGRFNQTRMFTAEMATVVLNPMWRVPPRIKEQELDLKLEDEPDFYEKHNYEVTIDARGREQVVQLPGPGNALGLVKFLFPNQFAIYMHDTPNKRLFKRTTRAFSHGCMRTEDPLDLARWILIEVQGMSEAQFDKIMKKREERHLRIVDKIPMTIDYVTVGVHESGRMAFFSDIYRYDKDYFAGDTPYRADRKHYQTVIVKK